jgi:hypothetical protein
VRLRGTSAPSSGNSRQEHGMAAQVPAAPTLCLDSEQRGLRLGFRLQPYAFKVSEAGSVTFLADPFLRTTFPRDCVRAWSLSKASTRLA